jgi:hypothetical protein
MKKKTKKKMMREKLIEVALPLKTIDKEWARRERPT